MFLHLNLNVKAKLAIALLTLYGVQAWSAVPYSLSELRSVENEEESKIRDLRDQEITQLRIALGRRAAAHRVADLYFRLAEIYLEGYHIEFLLEGRVHEKRLEKGIPDKFIDRGHSKPFLHLGIKACQEILGFRIPYNRMDQVYYFLAFNHAELDERAESAKYYSLLVQNYPHSQFAGVAYKELAEYYYKGADFQKSVRYFENAKAKMPSDTWPPLLHRMAWAYYRTKQYGHAIAVMKESIASATQLGGKYLPVREEALQDLATLMAESGRVDEALAYFEEVAGDKDYFPRILEKLGHQYERNVELTKAIKVYESLLKTHPESDAAFRVLVKLVELDIKDKRYSEAIGRLKKIHVPSGGNSETQAAAQNLRVMIRKVATEHHQDYRKKTSRNLHADLEIAEMFYAAYLEYFLKNSDPHQETPEIQMYLAEVKRDLGKPNEVVGLYRAVVKSQDARYSKQAGMLWISSLVEALKKAPQRQGDANRGPSEMEKEFIEAADVLMTSLENTNQAKEVALRAAQVQAGYAVTRQDAISRIKDIISRWPKSTQALTAAQLWVQLCLDLKPHPDPNELESVVHELRDNSELMAQDQAANKGKLKSVLNDQATQIKVSTIAKQEREKDYIAAAKGYEDFAKGTSDRDAAEKAYTNAVSTYLKASQDTSDAILSLEEVWSKRYPHSTKAMEPLRTVATNALIRGNFIFSARIFDKLGTSYKDPAALETSARLYEAIDDAAQAQHEWSRYLELYKDSSRRWAVALAFARSQDLAHLDGEANRTYRYCATGPGPFQAECYCRLADLYMRDKDVAQAKSLFQMVAAQKTGKKSGPLSPYVGYARYRLADLAESQATFEPLKFPEAQLQKALSQRLNFLEPLGKAYQSAVQVGGPWAIAALHRLALWATHFADEVDAIEPPSTLQGKGLEKFKKDLASISSSLREKAKSTWNESYTKATAVNLLSPALPEVADHLADFKVPVPGRAQGPRGKFHLAGIPADGGPSGAAEALQKARDRLLQNAKDEKAWTDYGNLLWGEGKPLMAKIAYERATSLNSKNTPALNNLAVVIMSSEGEEDWLAAGEGLHLLEEALRVDDFYIPAKVNLATLLNYYKIFAKAKLLWDQVLVRSSGPEVTQDAEEGLGVALQGIGNPVAAEGAFQKLTDAGGDKSRFTAGYHEAARYSLKGAEEADKCIGTLEVMDTSKLLGFEKISFEYLKGKCESWKK